MTQDALAALAAELRVVASWHSGPKRERVLRLAEQADALAAGQQVPVKQIAASKATTAAPPPPPAEPGNQD